MSKPICTGLPDVEEKSEGSDADSESSSKSTIVSVNNDKNTASSLPSTDTPVKEPENITSSQDGDKPDGNNLQQSQLARLRRVFQDTAVQDAEIWSDYEKPFPRFDYSDAESASSTDLETSPRPKLLSDYSLEYITCKPGRDFCDRDYMGAKGRGTNRPLKVKDRRQVVGKRREPYNLQTENKSKKLNSLNKKQDQCSEDKNKLCTNSSIKTSQSDVVREICPDESIPEFKRLKPTTSLVKIPDDETSEEPSISLDLRKYKQPTRIPVAKVKRDMEGILKAADDQFNSLDSELPLFLENMIDFETDSFEKSHKLEVIEESCYETVCKEDTSDETLSVDLATHDYKSVNEEIQEKTSDVSLDKSEYTVDLIEEALRHVSMETQLKTIEEEQPSMIENRNLRNSVNPETSDENVHEYQIISSESEKVRTTSVQKTESASKEKSLFQSCCRNKSTTKCESPTHKLLRVSLAKGALMKYAAKIKKPGTVKHDGQVPTGNKSVNIINQNADANSVTEQASSLTSNTENNVMPHFQFSTDIQKTGDGERNAEVLSNVIKHIPFDNFSLDDDCVVANISSQQCTVYIKLKKDNEGCSENRTPAAAEVQKVELQNKTPKKMLKNVTCTDPKHRCDGSRPRLQIDAPTTTKETPKIETSQNKIGRFSSKARDKLVQPRIRKTKPTVNVIRSNKQRMNTDFPVKRESTFHSIANKDSIYERDMKRKLVRKVQEGKNNRRVSVPLQHHNDTPLGRDCSRKFYIEDSATKTSKIPSLKSWLAMRQKRHQAPAKVPRRKVPRLVPKLCFDKVVRETRASLLRKTREKKWVKDSLPEKDTKPNKGVTPRKENRKGTNTTILNVNEDSQPQCKNITEVKEKPKAKRRRISPGFIRQSLDFTQPEAWKIKDTPKFAYFCASSDTEKPGKKLNTSKQHQPKSDTVAKKSRSPRTNEKKQPKKVADCVAPERTTTNKETVRREKALGARRKVREYLDKYGDINVSKSPGIQSRALSKEQTKSHFPEIKRNLSTRSVDFGRQRPFLTPGVGSVWSRVRVSCSQKCVMDAERLAAPIRQELEQEGILDKESIARDAIENVFKNLNSYLVALDSSSDSSFKTCPALHFKHTIAGDELSSEDEMQEDIFDSDEVFGSDSKALLLEKEWRLECVKLKIQKEPLVSDLKWSLLVAACHGYNFDKYLTPFPQRFVRNGRKDIDALVQVTEEVPPLPLLCNLSANEVSPSAIELLHWLLVELSGVKVVATSTREAEGTMPTCPDAVFSVWQRPSTLLDRRLRSNGRGLSKVEAFCCARLDKFHALLHGGVVPSGVMRRDVKMALEQAKPGYGYGCSVFGPKIKCVARCQVLVHPRLVELSEDTATVRGRNLVRVQQLLVFREHEDQETNFLPHCCHVAKIVLVVLGVYLAAFGLLWTFTMWEEPLPETENKRSDYGEAFPWLRKL